VHTLRAFSNHLIHSLIPRPMLYTRISFISIIICMMSAELIASYCHSPAPSVDTSRFLLS